MPKDEVVFTAAVSYLPKLASYLGGEVRGSDGGF